MATPNLKIVELLVSDLTSRARNPRTHSRKQIRKIADSISKFGFVSPVLIEADGTVIAGHGRLEAAKVLGLGQVPTVTLSHLSAPEIRAYVIADNKLASLSDWDNELLALELVELEEVCPNLDLTVTGFEIPELDRLRDADGSIRDQRDEQPLPDINRAGAAVTRIGDLWEIGPHRLLCGDALDITSYRALMANELADAVITDPPYNVPVFGHVSMTAEHDEFVMASGEMSVETFRRFLSTTCRNLSRVSRSGSLHFIFMDWRSIDVLLAAGSEAYDGLLNIIVWVKKNGGMGSLYRSRHELVALFRNGQRPYKNNVQLGSNGRYRTNVWEYAGANDCGPQGCPDRGMHPTIKNLEMIADAIRDVTDPGDIVLDAFGGSGTTLLAAARCGRRCRMLELDSHYCDLIIQRACGEGFEARLTGAGESFEETKVRRADHTDQATGEAE